jgi:His-Xaa-Ser system protein HxsD
MGMVEKLEDGEYRIEISSGLYEKEAVFAAAHRLNELFYIRIEPAAEGNFAVTLKCRESQQNGPGAEKAAHGLLNGILEEQVRLDISRRTGSLREIIYQHAFLPIEEQKSDNEKTK